MSKGAGGYGLRGRTVAHSQRSAMTLIELLVAISIVAILATLLLGVAAKAAETAREARTKQLISRLHTLVIERYESYRLRRVEIYPDVSDADKDEAPDWLEVRLSLANTGFDGSGFTSFGQWLAAGRLAGVRELMKMEMPDRWSDILLEEVPDPLEKRTVQGGSADAASTLFVTRRSSLNSLYVRRYNEAVARGVSHEDFVDNQNAECLYLIVMNATADGEASSLFKESDIGDTDEDGMPEFIDAWGNPIRWIRWAPGFDSDLQTNASSLTRVFNRPSDNSKGSYGAAGVQEAIAVDHDPFDLFRVDRPNTSSLSSTSMTGARAWRLVPLIFSAGPDESSGLRIDADPGNGRYRCRANPYADVDATTSGTQWLGESSANPADTVADNITNHHITAK